MRDRVEKEYDRLRVVRFEDGSVEVQVDEKTCSCPNGDEGCAFKRALAANNGIFHPDDECFADVQQTSREEDNQ